MLSPDEKEQQAKLSIFGRLAQLEDDVDDLYNLLAETVNLLRKTTDQLKVAEEQKVKNQAGITQR